VDRRRKLLADEVIAPREFAVARERLIDAIGVAAAQRPRRMPWQQSLDLVRLRLFVGHVPGPQPSFVGKAFPKVHANSGFLAADQKLNSAIFTNGSQCQQHLLLPTELLPLFVAGL
jgi:hypothetical protein